MYIIEYQPQTAVNRWRHRQHIRRMAERVLPQDYTLATVLIGATAIGSFVVLFLGWWLA